jgi:hypothetical protein
MLLALIFQNYLSFDAKTQALSTLYFNCPKDIATLLFNEVSFEPI